MNQVIMYTDGSCKGNPGPGGWGVVLLSKKDKTKRKELSGSVVDATNNTMELRGAIEGLKALKRPCLVQIRSDSRYLVDGGNGKTRLKANKDLWRELAEARKPHKVIFQWLKGHNGHPENEICDELAKEAALDAELEAEFPDSELGV